MFRKSAREARLKELWREFLRRGPTDEELFEVMRRISRLRETALRIILKREGELNTWTLIKAMKCVTPDLREEVGIKILERKPGKDQLKEIFLLSDPLKEKICRQILLMDVTTGDILFLLRSIEQPVPLTEEIWQKFLSINPTKEDLFSLIQNETIFKPFQERAANILLRSSPTKHDLLKIIGRLGPGLEKRVWDIIVKKNATKDDLVTVVLSAKTLTIKLEAWQKIKEAGPNKETLLPILKLSLPTIVLTEAFNLALSLGLSDEDLFHLVEDGSKIIREKARDSLASNHANPTKTIEEFQKKRQRLEKIRQEEAKRKRKIIERMEELS